MNELNVFERICRHLFWRSSSAQCQPCNQPVRPSASMRRTLPSKSCCSASKPTASTFAYIDADINPGKRVSVKAVNRSIASIIAEVLPNVNMEVKGLKIVL